MKLVLINPTPPGINAFGVRSLSAVLRAEGHEVILVFLPGSLGRLKEGGGYSYTYSDAILNQISALCRDADLVGVSFFSNYLERAIQITHWLKTDLGIPVIWGGIHASTKPAEALIHADMVCIGEGELTLSQLLQVLETGGNLAGVEGLWFTDNAGQIVRNDNRGLIADLDTLPGFDFSNQNHYIHNLQKDTIEPVSDELFLESMPFMPNKNGRLLRTYRTLTDRGCPHSCAYCNVPTLQKLYRNDPSPFLRTRSPDHVISELVEIKKKYSFVEAIHIFDDTFFARPYPYLEAFAALYKQHINLPMYCQASPNTLKENKLKTLIDAGLIYVEMGIQTGSERIRKLYARTESNEQILRATELLNTYSKDLVAPDYHIILDNPWETEDDTLDTVRLLNRIPKPFGLAISSLTFYPGTALYEKAVKDGLIQDEMKEVNLKPFYIPPEKSYADFLVYLMTYQYIPRFFTNFLLKDKMISLASSHSLTFLYKSIYALGETSRTLAKGLKAIVFADTRRLKLYLAKLRSSDPVVAGRKGK